MAAERLGELLERDEAAVARPPEPLAQVAPRPGGAPVIPEAAQVLLEQVLLGLWRQNASCERRPPEAKISTG
jgi:hypothetical protein